jgi:hypothetical protein
MALELEVTAIATHLVAFACGQRLGKTTIAVNFHLTCRLRRVNYGVGQRVRRQFVGSKAPDRHLPDGLCKTEPHLDVCISLAEVSAQMLPLDPEPK